MDNKICLVFHHYEDYTRKIYIGFWDSEIAIGTDVMLLKNITETRNAHRIVVYDPDINKVKVEI